MDLSEVRKLAGRKGGLNGSIRKALARGEAPRKEWLEQVLESESQLQEYKGLFQDEMSEKDGTIDHGAGEETDELHRC